MALPIQTVDIETGPLERVNVYLPVALLQRIETMRHERRWSKSATVVFIVEEWLREREAVPA